MWAEHNSQIPKDRRPSTTWLTKPLARGLLHDVGRNSILQLIRDEREGLAAYLTYILGISTIPDASHRSRASFNSQQGTWDLVIRLHSISILFLLSVIHLVHFPLFFYFL